MKGVDSNLNVSCEKITFEKNFDNSKYTVNIPDEKLNQFSDEEYLNAEKKMEINMLCQVSEQRCRPYFCTYSLCIHNKGSAQKCYQIYWMLNKCIEKERKKVIYQFLTEGKQPYY